MQPAEGTSEEAEDVSRKADRESSALEDRLPAAAVAAFEAAEENDGGGGRM